MSLWRTVVHWAALALLSLVAVASQASADEVKLEYRGLSLNANLQMAEGNDWTTPFVLMTHGTLAHNRMEIIHTFQDLLTAAGYNTLAINLSLSLDDRHGTYQCPQLHRHRHTDALDEIGVWLDWLVARGADDVFLFGHSRGGNQTAWFVAERDRPAVAGVVLVAPGTWSGPAAAGAYAARHGTSLAEVLQRAERMVQAGEGGLPLENVGFIYCEKTRVTADAFLDYYVPDPRRHTPFLLPMIPKPVLVVYGTEDRVIANAQGEVEPLAATGAVQLAIIDGADHFFRDLFAEEAVEAIADFIGSLHGGG